MSAAASFQPFVLKCPECTAPSEPLATHCRYCKVQLQWRPIISLSAFERYERDEDEVNEPHRPVLPFGPDACYSNTTINFQIRAQIPFRPHTLTLSPHCADHVLVEDILIGNRSQLIDSNPIPGWAFLSKNPSARIPMDTLSIDQIMTLRIRNVSAQPIMISGVVRGTVPVEPPVYSPSRPMSALPYPPGLFTTSGRRR